MSLLSNLQEYFVDKASFASLCGISEERLDYLLEVRAIPSASYVCDGRSVHSAFFGRTETSESIVGEYFRPECARWVEIAAIAPPGDEREVVTKVLTEELRDALRDYVDDQAEIEQHVQDRLPYFWDGTYGLCVAQPATGAGIVRKVMLQRRLMAITENGRNSSPEGSEKDKLLRLIDDYANSEMPFSPAEYERSSRKRLVDDLRPRVAKA